MKNQKNNRFYSELKKSQLLIASLFSIFLFLILEITWSLFYFWIPKIEKFFFEKELNILSKNYQKEINQQSIDKEKDIKRIKIWDYVVLLDQTDKNNFLVQKWGKNLWENLKKIVLTNKFSPMSSNKDEFSSEYFFSKSNLKEIFFIKNNSENNQENKKNNLNKNSLNYSKYTKIFTLDKKFFEKYEIPKNFSWIKKFSFNWRQIFIFNKKIFIKTLWKDFFYQAVIPSNIPQKAFDAFIIYFQIIILLISFLSFFIYYFVSKKILEPIKISSEKIRKFSDNVWHEIMSPVTIISWTAQLMEMWKNFIDENWKNKWAEKILEASKKIQTIVETLKKISLLERKNFQFEEKDLWKIIKNFITQKNILKKSENNLEILLKINNNISNKNYKKIDESIFYLILENLLSNAEKHKKEWTKIKIFLEKNKIIFENEIEQKISNKDLKKLKEKFFQVDNSRKSKWTWLWLSIVDECLKIFWWKINFFSNSKNGKEKFLAEVKF